MWVFEPEIGIGGLDLRMKKGILVDLRYLTKAC
jgi:hypothetical protein